MGVTTQDKKVGRTEVRRAEREEDRGISNIEQGIMKGEVRGEDGRQRAEW